MKRFGLIFCGTCILLATLVLHYDRGRTSPSPAIGPGSPVVSATPIEQRLAQARAALDKGQMGAAAAIAKEVIATIGNNNDVNLRGSRDSAKDIYIATLEKTLAQLMTPGDAQHLQSSPRIDAAVDPATSFDRFASAFVKIETEKPMGVGDDAVYDVTKTDSLVNPIIGTLICRPTARTKATDVCTFRFGLRENQWRLISVELHNEDGVGRITNTRPYPSSLFEAAVERANKLVSQ